jgi:hypothetical protein
VHIAAGSGGWMAVGSKPSHSATSFHLLAIIPAGDVVLVIVGCRPDNGVYWYWYSGKSMGFAASSSVSLKDPLFSDIASTDCSHYFQTLHRQIVAIISIIFRHCIDRL